MQADRWDITRGGAEPIPAALRLSLHPAMTIRALSLDHDIGLLHRWFTMDYARFWNMQDLTLDETRRFYTDLLASGHGGAYMGLCEGAPAFLIECYDPAHEPVGTHFAPRASDIGMHFFVGPPAAPIRHFTRDVLRHVMAHTFYTLGAQRVVVEPDARNDKVHALNRAVGFAYDRQITLPQKTAWLAFCTRPDFERSIRGDFTDERPA